MSDKQYLERDVSELLSRLINGQSVLESDRTESSIETKILVVPTLAERRYADEARKLLYNLYNGVTPDDFWQNVYLLEAVSSLHLRGIEIEDIEQRIRSCVERVLNLCSEYEIEFMLRAARAIVIGGLALKDGEIVEKGLIQARKVVESGNQWSSDLNNVLHALLALADLYKISNDEATLILIHDRLKSLDISAESIIQKTTDPELLSRFGIIQEKLDDKQSAEKVYSHVAKAFVSEEINTSALKYRIELGARLFGEIELKQVKFEKTNRTESTVEQARNDFQTVELPAEKPGDYEQPLVSVVIVQQGQSDNVTETVSSLLGQNVVPDEMVIIWQGKGRSLNLPDYNGSLVQITIDRKSGNFKTWQMGIAAASGKWVWMLPAGIKPKSDVLEKIVPFKADENIDAIFLSERRGELQSNLNTLFFSPSIAPEKVLAKRSLLLKCKKEIKVQTTSFWAIALEKLVDATWKEIFYKNGNPFDNKPNIFSYELIADASEIFREFKSKSSEDRKQREAFIEKSRKAIYDFYQNKALPLVSIIVDTMDETEASSRALESILKNTNHIPFEVITTVTSDTSSHFIDSLNELGLMLLRVENSQNSSLNRNKAAAEAKGKYLVFLGKDVEVQENWLLHLIQPLETNHSIGITGGMIHTRKGTILHAGVAFQQNAIPHRIHFGGSILQKSVSNPRKYQALDPDFILIRQELFEDLEGFSEDFNAPLNVYDFCLTTRLTGKGILYVPTAKGVKEDVPEIQLNRLWQQRWDGRVEEDLHLYAKIDGYEVDHNPSNSKMTPKGKHIPVQKNKDNRENVVVDEAKIIHKEPEHNEKDFVQLLVKAESQMKDGDYDRAENTLNEARSQVNGNVTNRVQYWTLLGDARFRLDKAEEAFQCYQKAVADDPAAQRAWIGIGTYHLVQGELEKAEQIFDKVITQNPDNLRGYLGRGNVKLQKKSPKEALSAFQKAATLDPGYRPTIVGLVAAALQAEKMQEALPSLERYLEIHENDIEARFHLAAIYYGISRMESAKEETNRVLEISPDHPGANELLSHLKEGGKS